MLGFVWSRRERRASLFLVKPKAWRVGRERNSLLRAAAVSSGAGAGWAQLRQSFLLFPARERGRKSSESRSCCKTGLWDGGIFGRRSFWTPLSLSLVAPSLLVLLASRLSLAEQQPPPRRSLGLCFSAPCLAVSAPSPPHRQLIPYLPFPSRLQFHGFFAFIC